MCVCVCVCNEINVSNKLSLLAHILYIFSLSVFLPTHLIIT